MNDVKQVWLKRDAEWIKNNPGKPTMYKAALDLNTPPGDQGLLVDVRKRHAQVINHSKTGYPDAGIYIIICESSKRVYVGQSINMGVRLRSHKMIVYGSPVNRSRVYDKMIEDKTQYGNESIVFLKHKTMPDASSEELTAIENDTMHDFKFRGYELYNIQVSFGNLCCPPEFKEVLQELIQHMIDKKISVNQLTALF